MKRLKRKGEERVECDTDRRVKNRRGEKDVKQKEGKGRTRQEKEERRGGCNLRQRKVTVYQYFLP